MPHAFRIVNVFTVDGGRLTGNPLCVFEDARGLAVEQMQALALQMNLSETTFVLPPERGGDARVRIFTPGFEMPFAGHPTLGTASVISDLAGGERDRVTLEMPAGLVPVTRAGRNWTLRSARPPATRPFDVARDDIAAMLGLPADAIGDRPCWVDTGVEQLVIPLRRPADVAATRPVIAMLERHAMSPTRREAMAYVWARPDGPGPWPVRFFFTTNGALLEDPATGSACATLGGWHVATGHGPLTATLRQGEAVNRPSRLDLRVDESSSIFVGGEVISLGRGTIDL